MGVSPYVIAMSVFVGLFTLAVAGSLVFGSLIFWKENSRVASVIFFLVAVMMVFACCDVLIRMYAP